MYNTIYDHTDDTCAVVHPDLPCRYPGVVLGTTSAEIRTPALEIWRHRTSNIEHWCSVIGGSKGFASRGILFVQHHMRNLSAGIKRIKSGRSLRRLSVAIESFHQIKLIYGSNCSLVFSRLSKWAQASTITLRHQYQVPWLDRCENGLKGLPKAGKAIW